MKRFLFISTALWLAICPARTQELYEQDIRTLTVDTQGNPQMVFYTDKTMRQYAWTNHLGVTVYVRAAGVFVGMNYGALVDFATTFRKQDLSGNRRQIAFIGWDHYQEPNSLNACNHIIWFTPYYFSVAANESVLAECIGSGFSSPTFIAAPANLYLFYPFIYYTLTQ